MSSEFYGGILIGMGLGIWVTAYLDAKQQLASVTQERDECKLLAIKLDRGLREKIDDCIAMAQQLQAREATIKELEQALRLHLAVSPDDPLLVEPVEQRLAKVTQDRDNLRLRIQAMDAEHADMERQKHKSIEGDYPELDRGPGKVRLCLVMALIGILQWFQGGMMNDVEAASAEIIFSPKSSMSPDHSIILIDQMPAEKYPPKLLAEFMSVVGTPAYIGIEGHLPFFARFEHRPNTILPPTFIHGWRLIRGERSIRAEPHLGPPHD